MCFNKFLLNFIFFNLIIFLQLQADQINNIQQKDQEIFMQANSYYKQSDYQKAYDLYRQISNKNFAVNYNLGNSAYKLDKLGYALLYWRRAQKDCSIWNQQELLDNIYLLKQKLAIFDSDKFYKNNLFFCKYKSLLISFFKYIPIIYLQLIFLLLWFFLFLYIRRLYRAKRKFLIFILFLLITISGVLLILRYNLEHKKYGIVVQQKTELLSGPGKNFAQLSVLPQASEFIIYKESDGYYKIKFLKSIGWVNRKDVEAIS